MSHTQSHQGPILHPAVSNAITLAAHYDAVAKASDSGDPSKHEPNIAADSEGDTAVVDQDLTTADHVEQQTPDPTEKHAQDASAPAVDDNIAQQTEHAEHDYGSEQLGAAAASGEATEYVSAPTDSSPRARRNGAERYHASMEQLKHLVAAFEENPCPPVATLNFLSESIGMPMHNLVLWFKNRRARSKKTHRLQGQRRSYVKSGIYSRTRRASSGSGTSTSPARLLPPSQSAHPPLLPHQPHHQQVALPQEPQQPQHQMTAQQQQTSASHMEEALPEQLQEQPVDETQDAILAQTDPTQQFDVLLDERKRGAPPASEAMITQPAKRVRVGVNVVDTQPAIGSACRSWSSMQCLNAFVTFFDRVTGGMNPGQAAAARAVAEQFFLVEMQSGLTVTSVAQSLQTSLEVVEQLIEKRASQGEPPLSSGSRAFLGEFIAQVRSGEAAEYDAVGGGDATGNEGTDAQENKETERSG